MGNRQAFAGLHGLQSYQGGPSQSKFIDVDQFSNAEGEVVGRNSMVSRRSNTDQKGEHLIKFDPRKVIPEMRKEESPLETRTEMNAPFNGALMDSALLASGSIQSKRFGDVNSISDKHVDDEEVIGPGDKSPAAAKQSSPSATGADQVLSVPNRTDSAFYEGKKGKPTKVSKSPTTKAANEMPLTEKQLSEAPLAHHTDLNDDDQSHRPSDAKKELNYHTTTEDAGDAYFP